MHRSHISWIASSLAMVTLLLLLHGRIDAAAKNVASPHGISTPSPGITARKIRPVLTLQSQQTLSPDGDGRGDVVQLMACTNDASPLTVTAYTWRASRGFMAIWSIRTKPRRDPFGSCESGYRAVASWDGSQRRSGLAADGSYLIDACSGTTWDIRDRFDRLEATPIYQSPSQVMHHAVRHDHASRAICSTQPVHVHVRRLDAYIRALRSIAPGSRIPLEIDTDRPHVTVELLPDDRSGEPAASWSLVPRSHHLRIPAHTPSGLYRLRIHGARDVTRWLPLVVGTPAQRHGTRDALVVWPLLTWRAYNHFDENRDGIPDSWYTRWSNQAVTLTGPFEHLGEDGQEGAENDAGKTRGFMHWLVQHPQLHARHITDVELTRMPLEQLRSYRLIVFPGHTEYVEPRMLALLNSYHRSGGNMMFLSANNLFRTVRIHPVQNTMQLLEKEPTRNGRRDYSLTGVGFAKLERKRRAPYVLHAFNSSNSWILAGISLKPGDTFGVATSEVDDIDTALSPRGAVIIAQARIDHDTYASMVLVPGYCGGGGLFSTGSMRFVRGMLVSRDASTRKTSNQLVLNVWRRFTDATSMRSPTLRSPRHPHHQCRANAH